MSASKNEPPSPRSNAGLPHSIQSQLHSQALLNNALANLHASADLSANDLVSGSVNTPDATLPPALLTADAILRRASKLPDPTELPDGLAERAIAKCLTVALDGSMAGEVVV